MSIRVQYIHYLFNKFRVLSRFVPFFIAASCSQGNMTEIFSKNSSASGNVELETPHEADATSGNPEVKGTDAAPNLENQGNSSGPMDQSPNDETGSSTEDQVARPGMIMGSFLVSCVPSEAEEQELDCHLTPVDPDADISGIHTVEFLLGDGRSLSFDRSGHHSGDRSIFIRLPLEVLTLGPVTVIVHVEGQSPAIVTENLILSETETAGNAANSPASPLVLSVEAYFPLAGNRWNDYVLTDKYSLALASDMPCPRSEATAPDECIHAGEIKKIILPVTIQSCDGLDMSDLLGAFHWTCEKPAGEPVRFYSTFKKETRLTQILDDKGFYLNQVQLTKDGVIAGSSDPEIWWPNQIKVLEIRSSGETMMIPFPEDETGTIYMVMESSDSVGIELVRSRTTLLTAENVTLSLSSTIEDNCEDVDASQSDANSKCLLFSDDEAFLWIEGNFSGRSGTDFIINGNRLKYSQFSHLNLRSASQNSIRLSESFSNRFEHTNIIFSNGITVENSYGNRFDYLLMEHISGTQGIQILESGKNLFFHLDIKDSNLESGVWLLGEEAEKNSFTDISIDGNILYGMRLGANSDYSRIFAYESQKVKIPVFIESSHDNTFQSLRFNQGVTGIAIQSGSYKNTVVNAGLFNFTNEAVYFNGGEENQISGTVLTGGNTNLCRVFSTQSPSVNNFCNGNTISTFGLSLERNKNIEDLNGAFGPVKNLQNQCNNNVYPLFTIPSGKTFLINAVEDISGSALTQNFNGFCENGEKCLFIDSIGLYPGQKSASFSEQNCIYTPQLSLKPELSFQIFGNTP